VTLSPVWEREIRDSVQGSLVEGWRIKMAPEAIQRFASAVGQATVSLVRENLPQVLLVHPEVRFFARKILDRTFPNVVVLAYSEIPREIRLSTVGVVE
jgi:flagellar biosynthesis protein FlhA